MEKIKFNFKIGIPVNMPDGLKLFLFLLVVMFGCTSNKQKVPLESGLAEPEIRYGIPSRYSVNNPNLCKIDFYYYIPAGDTNKAFPVMFLFDPHAKGRKSVERYISVADSLQIMMVGSNQLKNGMDNGAIQSVLSCLVSTTSGKFPVDTSTMVFTGFSGGGRIALENALLYKGVKGVISCGAAHIPTKINSHIPYIFIAGEEDFNYLECRQAILNFPTKQYVFFHSFDGEHEWPPADNMRTAIQTCLHRSASSQIFSYSGEENQVFSEEFKERNIIQESMGSKNLEWWKNYITQLNTDYLHRNRIKAASAGRLLGFISMLAYMHTERALKVKDMQYIQYCLVIYHLVDPDNPDMHFFNSWYNCMIRNNEHAMHELEKSVALGFSDMEKLQNSPIPSLLQNDPGYAQIISMIIQAE